MKRIMYFPRAILFSYLTFMFSLNRSDAQSKLKENNCVLFFCPGNYFIDNTNKIKDSCIETVIINCISSTVLLPSKRFHEHKFPRPPRATSKPDGIDPKDIDQLIDLFFERNRFTFQTDKNKLLFNIESKVDNTKHAKNFYQRHMLKIGNGIYFSKALGYTELNKSDVELYLSGNNTKKLEIKVAKFIFDDLNIGVAK